MVPLAERGLGLRRAGVPRIKRRIPVSGGGITPVPGDTPRRRICGYVEWGLWSDPCRGVAAPERWLTRGNGFERSRFLCVARGQVFA